MSMSARDRLLSVQPVFRTEVKEMGEEGDKFKVELRQPSVGARTSIWNKSKDGEEFDSGAFLVWGLIECAYDHATGEKLFTEEDFETLLGRETGGWVDELGQCVSSLMATKEDVEAKAKNLKETPKK